MLPDTRYIVRLNNLVKKNFAAKLGLESPVLEAAGSNPCRAIIARISALPLLFPDVAQSGTRKIRLKSQAFDVRFLWYRVATLQGSARFSLEVLVQTTELKRDS
jgi:hypothetical protein